MPCSAGGTAETAVTPTLQRFMGRIYATFYIFRNSDDDELLLFVTAAGRPPACGDPQSKDTVSRNPCTR